MPVPTVPTISSILTEAFKRAGIPSPTTAQLTRAEDEWFEEVKRDLQMAKKWHVLEDTIVLIPQAFVAVYQKPSPLLRVLRIRFYDGALKGTVQTATSSTFTAAAGTGTDNARGRKVYLTSGTGAGQSNRIVGRAGDIYMVGCAWDTTPGGTTTYMIADREDELIGPDVSIPLNELPANAISRWDEIEDLIRLYPSPDVSTYALELDGTVDISLVDETSVRYTRLLREWRTALIYGVMVRIFEDNDDQNAITYEAKYEAAKNRLMIEDSRKRRHLLDHGLRSLGGLPRGMR